MHLCTCSKCIKATCTNKNGQSVHGQWKSRQIRLQHHKQDLKLMNNEGSSESDHEPTIIAKVEDKSDHITQEWAPDDSMSTAVILCIFLGWLHVYCGLSRVNCQKARHFILEIIAVAHDEEKKDREMYGITTGDPHKLIPKDVRTIVKRLDITPELQERVCCSKCFSLYQVSEAPWTCTYKKTARANMCDEELFTLKTMYRGVSEKGKLQIQSDNSQMSPSQIGVPRSVYVTQTLVSWLGWFLKKDWIEHHIENWKQEVFTSNSSEEIFDIQQSPAFAEIFWPNPEGPGENSAEPPALNLVFLLFIDWFNPRGNRQSGKQQSLGVLSYNCLNLSPKHRNLIANTCVAGITPGPNAPDMHKISHVLEGPVDELLELEKGIKMSTNLYPDGRLVRVKLLTLLGDSVGMHKVAGFASHAAYYFCCWCHIHSNDSAKMVLGKSRVKEEVIEVSKSSKDARTLDERNQILKTTGVRWSEFNQLLYRDPVLDLPLGMMHNWYEGVLHQHFRYRWGFVSPNREDKAKAKRRRSTMEISDRPAKRMVYEEGMGNVCDENDSEDGEFEYEEDEELHAGWNSGLFSEEHIRLFRKLMKDIVLPSGITRLPPNLGESKHGKLKAAQWHSLFAYVIPLIILDIFVLDIENIPVDSNRGRILLNIADLCQCTYIVCAKSVTKKDAEMFEFFYKRYHQNSVNIFKELVVVPNHHYALHIPEMIRRWGPLNQIAEFAGERLIGTLQNIETNTHLAEMDRTMMCRFGQLQRLTANHPIDDLLASDSKIHETSWVKGPRIVLQDEHYDILLTDMQLTSPHIRHYRQLPHPPNAQILHSQAVTKSNWKVSEHVSVSVLKPNNVIKYRKDGKSHYAMIRQIYVIQNPTGGHEAKFLVNPIEDLFFKDRMSPSKHFRYIVHLLKCVIGRVRDTSIFVSPRQVLGVSAYRLLPNNVYGIAEGGIVLRPCDKRSQYAES